MNERRALILGRRAKRCNRWKWAPGMLTFTGYRVSDEDAQTDAPTLFPDDKPDLRDPATLGCLLGLVRDAWPTAPATTSRYGMWSESLGHYHAWTCSYCTGAEWRQAHGETEIEALIAALEAAGVQDP